jgi:hypothetical protein
MLQISVSIQVGPYDARSGLGGKNLNRESQAKWAGATFHRRASVAIEVTIRENYAPEFEPERTKPSFHLHKEAHQNVSVGFGQVSALHRKSLIRRYRSD